jgi:ParB family transcriptional regulator, chromosome partitioning protein
MPENGGALLTATVSQVTLAPMTAEIELDRLRMSPHWPRRRPLPWPNATELARARAAGLVEPVIARPLPDGPPDGYEILTGLKQWLLAQRIPRATVPVVVREVGDAVARRWVEVDARATDRDPLAEARALAERVAQGLSVAAAGREFGLSRTDASHRLRLLRLAPDVRAMIAAGALAPGLARALVGLEEAAQRALAGRIRRERLTARQVEQLARAHKTGPGPGASSAVHPARSAAPDPDQLRLEHALAERMGTPVAIRYDPSGRGELTIGFDSLEILDGVLEKLGIISQ